MFLIQCTDDKSLCIVKEENVICDAGVVKNGDSVNFIWKKKSYVGQILKRSDNHEFLAEELKKINLRMTKSKEPALLDEKNETLGKRSKKKPRSFSPSDHSGSSHKVFKSKPKIISKKKAVSSQPKTQNTLKKNKSKKNCSPDSSISDEDIGIAAKKKKLMQKKVTASPRIQNVQNDIPKKKINTSFTSVSNEDIGIPVENKSLEQQKASNSRVKTEKMSNVIEPKNIDSSVSNINEEDIGFPVKEENVELRNVSSDNEPAKDPTSFTKSPTKEELKKMLQNYQRLVDSNTKNDTDIIAHTNSKRSTTTGGNPHSEKIKKERLESTPDPIQKPNDAIDGDRTTNVSSLDGESPDLPADARSTINNDDDNDQLFGHNYAGEEMVLLQDDIYCRKKVHRLALGTAHLATHVARKLLEGVFKHETLLKCTLTGQGPRAQGKDRQNEDTLCMHEAAREAIIKYAQTIAQRNHWTEQTAKEIKKAMAQKLVEIKQTAKKNRM